MAKVKKFIDGTKLKCSRCELNLIADEHFHKNKSTSTGYTSSCKSCVKKQYNKEARYFNANQELKCRECKKYKNIDDYYVDNTQKYRKFRSQACKLCEKERCRLKRLKNYSDDIVKVLRGVYNGAKQRSGHSLDFKVDFLIAMYKKQHGKCAISGLEMTGKRGKGRYPYNVSIDRIDSSIGYLKSNIQLVCGQVNMMKGTLHTQELITICQNIINNAQS